MNLLDHAGWHEGRWDAETLTKVLTRLIHGMKDQVVPIEISRRYEAAARKAGDDARLIPLPATAHFELIDPGAIEYRLVSSTIRSGLL